MIKQIQVLRFLAAMWVAIFHGSMLGIFADASPWVDFVIKMGYAGVDVFFVISGVIMAHSTKNMAHGPQAAKTFFLVRFSRIYTGWWPALLLYIAFFKITHQFSPHINLHASFFLYFTELTGLINIAIWSLMFELYFYILVSVGLLFPGWQRQIFLKLLFAALVLVNVYFFIHRPGADAGLERDWVQLFYVAPIVAEFFLGYFLYNYLQDNSRSSWRVWGLLAVIAVSLFIYLNPHFDDRPFGLADFHYWPERSVLVGGAALAIVGLAMTLPFPRSKIALAMARFGDYSYSIYLLHILAFNMMLTLLHWGRFDGWQHTVIAVGVLAALLLASAVYYHAVEYPLYMLFRRSIYRWSNPLSSDRSVLNPLYKNRQPR